MATLLDDELETHDGPEPRVLTEDVRVILRAKIRPELDDAGESVMLIAKRADVSTRTIYRILNPAEAKETISLRMADNLCIASDSHLAHCRLKWPDGRLTDYAAIDAV